MQSDSGVDPFAPGEPLSDWSDRPVQPVRLGSGGAAPLMRNVLSNWTNLGVAILYSLVITPVVIAGLDQENYGIWVFLNALVSYSSLFYFGLGTMLMRFGSRYYATGNREALNRLVSVVMTIYTGVGLLLLVAGLVAAPYIPRFLLAATSDPQARVITLTVVVLACRLALVFVATVFSGVVVAQGRTDLQSLIAIGGHLSRLVAVPFAVQSATPLLALAVTVTITGAIEVVATIVVAFRTDPGLRARFVRPKSLELRALYGLGFLAFLVHLSDRLISYADTTVIGLVLGAAAVGLYSLPLQLVDYGRTIVFGISSVMLPHLAGLQAAGELEKFRWSYLRTVKVAAFIAAFINVNIIALGPAFIHLWVGPPFSDAAQLLLICLGAAAFVQAAAVQCQIPFCIALGRLRFAAFILGIEGLSNLGLSLWLAPHYGISGVAIGTVIPAVLISGLFLPMYVARRVGVSLRLLALQVVWPVAWFVGILTTAQLLLQLALGGHSYVILAVRGGVVGIVALGVAWFLVSHSDRRPFVVMAARALRRSRRAR